MLFFPPGTKMVHFPGFASRSLLYSGADIPILIEISLKDSEIPGSQPVCGSPRLIAAYHVLHRLPSPRHPPYALSSLTIKFAPPEILGFQARGNLWPLKSFFTRRYLIVKDHYFRLYRKSKARFHEPLTPDTSAFAALRRTSPPKPMACPSQSWRRLVEVSGFEPLTPCLQSRCSSS